MKTIKNIGALFLSILILGFTPTLALASGGHARGSGALSHSIGSADQTLIFLAMLGNIIVLSMVASEVIRRRREQDSHGTQQQ